MTELEKTEDKISNNGIELHKYNNTTIEACSIKLDSTNAIFFNTIKLDNSIKLNTALCHEYYHLENDSLYTFGDSLQTRKRREFKANYQMAIDLLPPEVLTNYFNNGYQLYEISEKTCLTEEFILEAIRIYKSKGLL